MTPASRPREDRPADPTFARLLRDRIAREGSITVGQYMAAANAHYYATRDPFGPAGDFVTAPEIHQMFGEMVGAALVDVWDRAGRPTEAIFAELGPGRGTLAADALRVMRGAGFSGEIHLVETSATLRKAQAGRVPDAVFHDTVEGLPERPLLLIANEFFDALPVEQWVGDEQRRVTLDEGGLAFTTDGDIRETSPDRSAAMAVIADRLARHGGAALIIDYGYAGGETGDTLQAVRSHAHANPLQDPGEQDLTAHVDFAALAAAARGARAVPSRVVGQGSWLETLGIGVRASSLAARNPAQTEAIAAARRRLCDEAEMGRLFKVLGVRAPNWPDLAGLST
ncbi:class I SAM-dependent methyltransferase [Sphingomonas sp. LY160]|uniref:class I SAM-dependent methyltransferase n=1 Tax=Sphingomonas sp. LY160 TaxID=3095342 RepID=UPI002ADEF5C0|nr:SAM-dependent methyltransferase [Sphingomonas sp. LY160]MEA1072161.1 SAM-dependent methyltransferase [Sphingomonas sp. LY160]